MRTQQLVQVWTTGFFILLLGIMITVPIGCATVEVFHGKVFDSKCSDIVDDGSAVTVLTKGECFIGMAAHTLANGADAGIVSRDSEEYTDVAVMILDAGQHLDRGWELYMKGDGTGAVISQRMAMELYTRTVRPYLVRHALGGDQ